MNAVKLGIVGTGTIAQLHMENIRSIPDISLKAVCDVDFAKAQEFAEKFHCEAFADHKGFFKKNIIDAVLIATPHYSHTQIGIDALNSGLHVLVEKPISVHKADCERLIAAHKNKNQVFAAVFNQRTNPCYSKIKELLTQGDLGDIIRINWISTDWFRTDIYYKSSSWRATWAGEGGGVLLNQCPHQLDLWQWFFGMPAEVQGFCGLGKRHDIEVEDEVTAYFEYKNGATGVFIASTGEVPGTNRLEICADKGKIVVEKNKLELTKNIVGCSEFMKLDTVGWEKPKSTVSEIIFNDSGGQHKAIMQNFADAIINGAEPIAPAEEGLNSVELANAVLFSSLCKKTVKLPLDSSDYEAKLMQLTENSLL